MAKRKKWQQVVWIIISIMIGFTMILFTAGGALLTGGGSTDNNYETRSGY